MAVREVEPAMKDRKHGQETEDPSGVVLETVALRQRQGLLELQPACVHVRVRLESCRSMFVSA